MNTNQEFFEKLIKLLGELTLERENSKKLY